MKVDLVESLVKLKHVPACYLCLAEPLLSNNRMNFAFFCNINSTKIPESPKRQLNKPSVEYKQLKKFPAVVQIQTRGYASFLQ